MNRAEESYKRPILFRTYLLGLLFVAVVVTPRVVRSLTLSGSASLHETVAQGVATQPAYENSQRTIEFGTSVSTPLRNSIASQRRDSGNRLWFYTAPLDRTTNSHESLNLSRITSQQYRVVPWLNYDVRSTQPVSVAQLDFEHVTSEGTTWVVSSQWPDLVVRFSSGIGALESSDGIVILPGKSGIRAFSAETGSMQWRFEADEGSWLAASGDLILAVSENRLYALNPKNGAIRWVHAVSSRVRRLFLSELGCAYTDRFQNIYFVDVQTGELKWSSNSIHYLAFSEDGRVFIYADVAELNGDKIIPQITAYDVSTGALLWRWEGEDELWGHGSYSAFPSQGVAAISLKYKTDVGRVASLFPARVVVFVGLQFGDCMGELAFPTGVSSIFPVRDALAIISGTGVPELHRVNGDRIELVEENGLLDIEVHPPRARIYIDNEYIGTGASLRTRLPVGIFSISGKCQLYSTAVQTLEITTGGAESIRLVLEPDANIPRPRNREKNALSTRPQLPIEQNRFGDDGVQP